MPHSQRSFLPSKNRQRKKKARVKFRNLPRSPHMMGSISRKSKKGHVEAAEGRRPGPVLIVLCPPCTAFSIVQELNLPKMQWAKAVKMIQTGLEHLHLAIEVAKWQVRRGRYIVVDQPETARSWKEESVQELKKMAGVMEVSLDQCMYGLQVDELGLNKKPTKLLVNSCREVLSLHHLFIFFFSLFSS